MPESLPLPLWSLVIATRNAHKIAEIQALLGSRCRCLGLRDWPGAPEPAETGSTFAANARIKAEAIAGWLATLGLGGPANPAATPAADQPRWVLADDSGLEVDALGGAPGVQSARFASEEFGLPGNAPDGANNAKLLRLLAPIPAADRSARFRCTLALTATGANPDTRIFDGACEGQIGFTPRGAHGFGYDPLFVPHGYDGTFAELGEETKSRISHRSRALAALIAWLDQLPNGRLV